MARKPEAVKVLSCGVCGLPAEYCAFGPDFDRCKPWLIQNAPRIYANIKDENCKSKKTIASASPNNNSGIVRVRERVSQTKDSKNITSSTLIRNKGERKDKVGPKSSTNKEGEGMQMSISIETARSFTRERTEEHYGPTHLNVMQNTGCNYNGSGTQTIGDVNFIAHKTVKVYNNVTVFKNVINF